MMFTHGRKEDKLVAFTSGPTRITLGGHFDYKIQNFIIRLSGHLIKWLIKWHTSPMKALLSKEVNNTHIMF